MICIFSYSQDNTTTEVIKWLHHFGRKDVIRVNSNDTEQDQLSLYLSNDDLCFSQNGVRVALKDISIVWYRKGRNWLCDQFYPAEIDTYTAFTQYLNHKLKQEETRLAEYLHFLIEQQVPTLGAPSRLDLNKLQVLHIARSLGLNVPAFYISNYRDGFRQIAASGRELVTKAISDGLYFFDHAEKELGIFSYTESISQHEINNLPESFSPSLVQERIDKLYELRIFYLDGQCSSMAIFSQNDEETKVDFRKYRDEKPNRFVPYHLPEAVTQKLCSLFEQLQLNTGSADMIVDRENNYYFLEINPVGQFGMVSTPCNYFLEKQIALYLIGHEKEIVPET